jgi:hypothetical protein
MSNYVLKNFIFCEFSLLFTRDFFIVKIVLVISKIEVCINKMKKLELLSRIQNLASLLHCDDLKQYNLTTESVKEMHRAMDALTEEYIACYC